MNQRKSKGYFDKEIGEICVKLKQNFCLYFIMEPIVPIMYVSPWGFVFELGFSNVAFGPAKSKVAGR